MVITVRRIYLCYKNNNNNYVNTIVFKDIININIFNLNNNKIIIIFFI